MDDWSGIRAITFDVGGTLLRVDPSPGAIYARVLAEHGLVVDAERMTALMRRAYQAACERKPGPITAHGSGSDSGSDSGSGSGSGSDVGERQFWSGVVREVVGAIDPTVPAEPIYEELWEAFTRPEAWRLFDGAVETLETLAARGYRVGVLSNWDTRLRALLEHMGITPRVELILVSAEVGIEKPDRGIFDLAQAHFGYEPAALLHVGDIPALDEVGAHGAGWHAAIIEHEREPDPATRRIGRLVELLDWLPGPRVQA